MHRIAATPGGWNPQAEGVIVIEQSSAPIIFLTAADTDIQTLAAATSQLPSDFPALRVVNLLQLQQQLTIDTYAETVLSSAQIIIVRLLGGRAYWSYGLEVVQATVQQTGAALVVLPGDDRPDPDLISHSTVTLGVVNQLWCYLTEGGVENFANALKFIADIGLGQNYNPPPPQLVPRVGIYDWKSELKGINVTQPIGEKKRNTGTFNLQSTSLSSKVGILFYRAHYLSGNTAPIDALCQALAERQLEPVPIFVSSLRDPDVQAELLAYFQPKDGSGIGILLNTTSFSLAKLDTETPQLELWQRLDVPVLQVILSGGTREQWESQFQGLTPRDTAMNVALPEVDGRIISRAVSFKSVQKWNPGLETDVVVYEAVSDRIEFVANLAHHWVKLRQTPPAQRRIALILANYPNRDGRLANGVGLDTPASCVEILKALQQEGYWVEDIPETGDELIQRLTAGVTNDPEGQDWRLVRQQLSWEEYQEYFETLPLEVQKGITQRWGFVGVTTDTGKNDAETRRHGDAESSRKTCDAGHETPLGVNVQGFEASSKSLIGTLGIGRSLNPRPIPVPASSPLRVPASLNPSPSLPIAGIQLGNVFVGIQPSRGYDLDPSLNYHAPDLEPTHAYLGFYYWLRQHFGAQAVVHVGKHGNLEWLPGKSVALSGKCYPEVALGAMPHLYPFIVNDPGEGSQAKRRSQAVIIDHLTPPMTRAELYGPLQQLEGLIDEYYEAQSLDPTRLPVICDRITQLILQENLHQDLGIAQNEIQNSSSFEAQEKIQTLLTQADGYLCELKEAQIRDGLHIFGQCPQERQLRDLIVAIARHPGNGRIGLTRAIAQDLGLDFDPLTADLSEVIAAGAGLIDSAKDDVPMTILQPTLTGISNKSYRTLGDIVERIEQQAAEIIEQLLQKINHRWTQINTDKIDQSICVHPRASAVKKIQEYPYLSQERVQQGEWVIEEIGKVGKATKQELEWICDRILPSLLQTNQEITQLLRGLDGRYIPSGPSGAPTRGRPEVLPTGRNFYSVDIRAIPTETAWDVGRKAAEVMIECYTQENGEYPKTLGLSVWGTSTMRTGGDDIAEALALLGVQPVWDYPSRRVVDFEILPVSVLGRPRVDVTLRISGFFRDAFPNLISLFDQAVAAVAALDEPSQDNPLAARVKAETQMWQDAGLSQQEAQLRSRYRIFGSKPGAYGAGLQGLIEAQNWTDEQDLARAYINWSSYAYTGSGKSHAAPEVFEQRLQQMQIVLQNQDNREHDLLDSDDYYQFQGGLTVAVRALTGKNPQTYFGDNSIPTNPRVRQLREEIARVYRSRVVNPKWIDGAMRHGYKGAFEMAATVDYLFAYDATTHCVEDHMYQGVAQAYLFDPKVQEFTQQKNPWALRDMAERLLEANQRGLWKDVKGEVLDQLRAIALQAEAVIESTSGL